MGSQDVKLRHYWNIRKWRNLYLLALLSEKEYFNKLLGVIGRGLRACKNVHIKITIPGL